MANKVGRVICKACGKVFADGDAWKTNAICDQPASCLCPKVQESMKKAAAAIEKAKDTSGYIVKTNEAFIPTNFSPDTKQVWVTVSPLLTMEIIKPKKRGGKRVP